MARSSLLPPESRSSLRRRASPMNPSAASHAVMPARGTFGAAVALVRCSTPSVPNAASPAKSPSSPGEIAPSIAAIVSADKHCAKAPLRRRLFYCHRAVLYCFPRRTTAIICGAFSQNVVIILKAFISAFVNQSCKNAWEGFVYGMVL